MRKLKMQIAVLALAFAAAVAAKMYVDKMLTGETSRRTVISDSQEPGTVTLPEADKKL